MTPGFRHWSASLHNDCRNRLRSKVIIMAIAERESTPGFIPDVATVADIVAAMSNRITLADVAKLAGVHPGTALAR